MTIKTILTEPNKILRQKSLLVEKVDQDLQKLMDDMLETMYAAPGIGLAAIQVGVPKRVIVLDIGWRDKSESQNDKREERRNPMYFVNPEIIEKSLNNSTYALKNMFFLISGKYSKTLVKPSKTMLLHMSLMALMVGNGLSKLGASVSWSNFEKRSVKNPQTLFLRPQKLFLLPKAFFLLPQAPILMPQALFLLPQALFGSRAFKKKWPDSRFDDGFG